MIERPKSFWHTHTLRGRYEEYQMRHAHIVAQTQGEARYLFEKTIDRDAKRYARNAVARDVLFTIALTGGAFIVAREIKRGTLSRTLTNMPQRVIDTINGVASAFETKTDAALHHIGEQIGAGIMTSAEEKAPIIGEQVAQHATEAIRTQVQVALLTAYADFSDKMTGVARTIFGGVLGLGKKS
jgi:hypothetical protein